jgi:hypothetical protein
MGESMDSSGPSAANEGFFVCFDSNTPQKTKPQLGKNRQKKAKKPESKVEPPSPPPPAQAPPREGDAVHNPPPRVNVSPGVGFVIADEAPVEKVRLELNLVLFNFSYSFYREK